MWPVGQKVGGGTTTKAKKEPELQCLGCKVLQAIPAFFFAFVAQEGVLPER